jgi:hypothetical protein
MMANYKFELKIKYFGGYFTDKWILWPFVLILQSLVFSVIKLFSINVIEDGVDSKLSEGDFVELFTALRNLDINVPIYKNRA